MQEALSQVRLQLGPDAAVLRTREVRGGLLRWLVGRPLVEVTATAELTPPRRLARRPAVVERAPLTSADVHGMDLDSLAGTQLAAPDRIACSQMVADRPSSRPSSRPLPRPASTTHLPESLFRIYAELIEANVHEDIARQLIDELHHDVPTAAFADPAILKARLVRGIEDEIAISGPIKVEPGRRRLVALVGPTGVGKTTTIAKLAAHFRLKERKRVGLITVDTFRIAAVEQLRAYADIIDLPMEVVSNPLEMRQAVSRLADLDLILMDTAGRSPRDEVKLQELKAMFAEAAPDEVHLVLSATCGAANLLSMTRQFAEVGVTSLLLTKMDEAHGLGNLLPLVRESRVPLSYLTNGQNVPDDIEIAEANRLSRMMIALEN